MLNPYVILGVVLFYAVSCAGSYFKGHSDGADKVQAKWDKAIEAQREKEAKQAEKAVSTLETNNAKAKVVYRTITQNVDRIVEKPVYRSVCLDADGLRVANEALSGSLAPPAKPDRPMSRSTTTIRWDSSERVAESSGSQ